MAGHLRSGSRVQRGGRRRRPAWIVASIRAFQQLFPDVSLPWWEYFNSGIIVLGSGQHRLVRSFLDHAVMQWPQLDKVMMSGNFGTEQTPLNFIVKQANEPVWHFTNVVALRSLVMGETWRRIRHNYPGALLSDED